MKYLKSSKTPPPFRNFQVEEDQTEKNKGGSLKIYSMNPDKLFADLSMSEKRKKLMAMVDMRRDMKRKRSEIPPMPELRENINITKPINKTTKMKKFNSHAYKKKFQKRGPKVKKVSHGDDNIASNDSSEIEEYWVPVHLSQMQIETYCSLLNSNLESLSSSLRDDSSLNDILIQTQKCCDHPYLVDPTLREKTDFGDERLDAEISVSGKLQLLDKLLLMIKKSGLRALVLFQSVHVTWKDISIGDILDDLVEKRFGQDSYIRIQGKITSNSDREKRRKDLKMFNNVDTRKFVCLLDYRACHSTIKLSSIDVVILFNTDWNPLNDVKALRRLTLDSKRLRVLRLYSSFTVEEKTLVISKQGSIFEGNTTRISYNNYHRLLAWGASYLFSQLSKDPKSKSKSDSQFMDDLLQELSSLLLNENGNTESSRIISNAQIRNGIYAENISLLGENEAHMKEKCTFLMENGPLVFWKNLLQEIPWKNSSSSRLSRRAQKSFRSPDYLIEEMGISQNNAMASPSAPTKSRSKRRRASTEIEHSTSYDAECTNNQLETSPVVPPVSGQSCNAAAAAPLEAELENIKKVREKANKLHEEKKSMLHSECEKEILEIRKKYDALIDESEICLNKEMNVLEEYYDLVYANKVLADTFTRTCEVNFSEEKTEQESGALRVVEIPASELVQSRSQCTSTISNPGLRGPAPHLRSSSSLFASLPIPQTPAGLNNLINQEKLPVIRSSNSWPELFAEIDSFYEVGYGSLPFLDSN